MKKILIILLFYPVLLFGQKLDYADEFAYEIHRNLDYAGNGNIRQALDIYIPYNRISEELPLVVYIHGGGWQRGSKDYAGRGMPYLRTGRYIFASINYRLLDQANILEMIYDCKAAIPMRIALEEMGHPQPKTPAVTDNTTYCPGPCH